MLLDFSIVVTPSLNQLKHGTGLSSKKVFPRFLSIYSWLSLNQLHKSAPQFY
nr:MAG TPA: hypothetical protein [Caudoviricetes sp.]